MQISFLRRFWSVSLVLVGVSVGWSAKADSLLARSAVFFKNQPGLSFDFEVLVRYAATGELGTQKGSLLVGERDRFRLKTPAMEFYSDGVNLWQYNPAQGQVMVKLLADLENKFHPSQILFKYLGCKALTYREETWQGQKLHALELDPSRYKDQFRAMEVWLDPKTLGPVRLKTEDNLGNISWYTVKNLKKTGRPQDSEFIFVAPPGVDEIDMR